MVEIEKEIEIKFEAELKTNYLFFEKTIPLLFFGL